MIGEWLLLCSLEICTAPFDTKFCSFKSLQHEVFLICVFVMTFCHRHYTCFHHHHSFTSHTKSLVLGFLALASVFSTIGFSSRTSQVATHSQPPGYQSIPFLQKLLCLRLGRAKDACKRRDWFIISLRVLGFPYVIVLDFDGLNVVFVVFGSIS